MEEPSAAMAVTEVSTDPMALILVDGAMMEHTFHTPRLCTTDTVLELHMFSHLHTIKAVVILVDLVMVVLTVSAMVGEWDMVDMVDMVDLVDLVVISKMDAIRKQYLRPQRWVDVNYWPINTALYFNF